MILGRVGWWNYKIPHNNNNNQEHMHKHTRNLKTMEIKKDYKVKELDGYYFF